MRSSVYTPYRVDNRPSTILSCLRFLPDLTVRRCTGHDEQLTRLNPAGNRPIRSDFPSMCGLPVARYPPTIIEPYTTYRAYFWRFTFRHAPRRLSELAVFDTRLYIRVRGLDERV
jgi:hypothetical protein